MVTAARARRVTLNNAATFPVVARIFSVEFANWSDGI